MSSITNITRRTRFISALAAALASVAAIPAGASAATTWFGSSLNHEPANAGSSCDQNNLDNQVFCTHVGSFYPGLLGPGPGRPTARSRRSASARRVR